MGKKIKELMAQMEEKWKGIRDIRDLVVQEEREFSQAERDTIEKSLDEVRVIEVKVEEERKDQSLMDQIDALGKGLEKQRAAAQEPEGQNGQPVRAKSFGQQFTESPEWQAWYKQNAPGGRVPDGAAGIHTPPVEMKGLLAKLLGRKELLTGVSAVSAGAFVESDRTGIYETLGRYPLGLRDLISVRQTGSDTVEFVRQTSQITQATTVAEANVTTFAGSTGEIEGVKPEATMRFVRVSEQVKTIAVWIPATKRALSDAAQLRGLIDDELRSDANEELENQLLNGDGVGENFTGLNNAANVLVQAFDTDIAATARKAITNLLINGRQIPSAYLLNPQDWEGFDLLQDTQGRYYWGGPMAQGPRTLWGVPVAQSFFQAQGTGWLANWSKMVLWDRMMATISVSDSHSDFFIRNLVAILCELRAAMGLIRPTAFVQIDLTSGS